MIERDNLHFTGRHMCSYNATWNIVYSSRESGKTTFWANFAYKRWRKEHCTTIVLRYLISDITDLYINDLSLVINDFLPTEKQVKFVFKKGSIKDGVVDCFIEGHEDDIPLFRFIAISNPISRIKSMKLANAGMIVMDEALLNTRAGESYPKGLVVRFKEIYNTYLRCCHTNKKFACYFFANPYSHYNPIWADFGCPMNLKEGEFYYDKKTDVYMEAYKLKQELKDLILKKNPLYKWDSSYTDYAFNGESINDTNFDIIEKQPEGYMLKWIFRLQNKYIYIYKCANKRINKEGIDTGRYWIDSGDRPIGVRQAYSVDLDNLINGTTMVTTEMKSIFWYLKNSIGERQVTYASIEAGYLIEALYTIL